MIEKIKLLASQYLPEVIAARRYLHAHPELSFQEYNTSKFIQQKLDELGIPYQSGVAGTGVVGFIKGKNPDTNLIALRADMDALPILEKSEVEYKSKKEGVMHACGHDVHTASLIGTAKILNELKNDWTGTVQLIFQPGEERLPGGASQMIQEGIFEKQVPNAIFGQHVDPEIPRGKVGFRPGMYMASTDEIYVTVKGKGGHAAKPSILIDPVLITSHLIIALQQVVSRWTHPTLPCVLSFGKVIAEGATNVIPNEVKLEGTFRTFDESWRKEAHERMKQLAEQLVRSMGGEVDFNIVIGYPVLHNHEETTLSARQRAMQFLGKENVVDLALRTTAEDFAYYSHQMPACFYRLGTASPSDDSKSYSVHNAKFDIDEQALEIGMGLMAWMVVSNSL